MFSKENISALLFKLGRYLAAMTHGVLTARSNPIAIVLVYLAAKSTLYAERLKNLARRSERLEE